MPYSNAQRPYGPLVWSCTPPCTATHALSGAICMIHTQRYMHALTCTLTIYIKPYIGNTRIYTLTTYMQYPITYTVIYT